MDPLSAFAFAVNVFQLIGIVLGISSSIRQIHGQGSDRENITIKNNVKDLEGACVCLKKELADFTVTNEHDKVHTEHNSLSLN